MPNLIWTTTSTWLDDSIEVLSNIGNEVNIENLIRKLNDGEILGERKISSSKRVFSAIKARYLNKEEEKVLALSSVIKSNISKQEKYNHMFLYYLEYETLAKTFLGEYVYPNYNSYSQKIYTQKDLDRFFEKLFEEKKDMLSPKLQQEISEQSMDKVRNQLMKFLEDFKWGEKKEGKLYIKRPNLSAEWFVYILFYYYKSETIDISEIHKSDIFNKFLLNNYDIEYFITQANIKGLIDVQRLGDINIICKKNGGLLEYARNY